MDNEKSKHATTRHASDISDQPLYPEREFERDGHSNWQLPNIARLSVLKIPDIEEGPSEEAIIYHSEKLEFPIVMDFSLAYPEATHPKSKL